jgi:ubiquinone/menaquinone biosynthesis C-methylase UbiE
LAQPKSLLVQNLLARPEMHRQWEGDYRTAENEKFYELAFDYIVRCVQAPPDAAFLDAGCGPAAHSVRLARHGFKVHAVDFSTSALGMARDYIAARGMDHRITLQRSSLLNLSFPSSSFDYVLCWGVLMHIPEVERAILELARVVSRGGVLVISESNKSSLEAVVVRNLKRLLSREKASEKERPEGVEYWKDKDGDALVTRQANISWLIRCLEENGLVLERRLPGQFSESYTRVSTEALKKLVHKFNKFWFERVRWAGPAFGNILIFRKPE